MPERSGSGRVTVGAQEGLARLSEALHVHHMADAVARPRVPDTVSAACAFEEKMIVGVQIVDLQEIVIDILYADLRRSYAVETERLQGQHDAEVPVASCVSCLVECPGVIGVPARSEPSTR